MATDRAFLRRRVAKIPLRAHADNSLGLRRWPGVLAAAVGILGYFNIAGLGPLFTLYDNVRATGPFKDPNVFGPFLVRRSSGWLRTCC